MSSRRILFGALMVLGAPLVMLAWVLEAVSFVTATLYALWWVICLPILSEEQRREYAAKLVRAARTLEERGNRGPWQQRLTALAQYADATST